MSSLTADVVYTFKVTARNEVGFGAETSEVDVKASAAPYCFADAGWVNLMSSTAITNASIQVGDSRNGCDG